LKLTRRRLKRAKAISVEHNRSHNSNAQQQQHNVSHCHHFFLEREKKKKRLDPLDRDEENEETGTKKETFPEEKKTHFPFSSEYVGNCL